MTLPAAGAGSRYLSICLKLAFRNLTVAVQFSSLHREMLVVDDICVILQLEEYGTETV